MATTSGRGNVRSASGRNLNAMKWNRTSAGGDRLSAATSSQQTSSPRGIKPVTEPMSLTQMGVVLLMHICRKILIWEPLLKKVAIYGAVLLFGSVLCDFFPLPKNILWQKAGLLNRYFAKFCWGWTLCLLGAYVGLTSYVYCCGVVFLVRRHLTRLLVATVCWYAWTSVFVVVESATGMCVGIDADKSIVDALSRDACLKRGLRWRGFDISGHVFLLIYCSLVIHEEAKSIRGWEKIKDLLRDVNYDQDSPLEVLSAEQLNLLKTSYERLGPYIRGLFVALTLLCLIWDFQVLGTVLYYHSMAQKVCGGLIAFFTWFVTYRLWYVTDQSPGLPGQGTFKFAEFATASYIDRRRSLNVVTPRAKLWRNADMAVGDQINKVE